MARSVDEDFQYHDDKIAHTFFRNRLQSSATRPLNVHDTRLRLIVQLGLFPYLTKMDLRGNGMASDNDLRVVRHDSPMNVDGPYENSMDMDVLRASVLTQRPLRVDSAMLRTPSTQIDLAPGTTTENIIGSPFSPQRPVSVLAMKPQAILLAPIPLSTPESAFPTEAASEYAKVQVIQYIDEVMASPFRAAHGEYRDRRARKLRITQDLIYFVEAVSRLQPEDRISCIEYVNARIIYEHNKTEKLGHNLIPFVSYPDADVALLRQTYSLTSTPLAEVFRMAESLISWPVEFEVRLPLIRKRQLEDLASGYPEASKSWSNKMIKDFEQMWGRLCRWHNGSFTKQHDDWVDPDVVDFEIGRTSSVGDEVASPVNKTGSTSEVVHPSKQLSPKPRDVEAREEKMVVEATDGDVYDSPTPGCEFCNRDRAYRPRCPGADIGACEDCNRRCSCGFLPSHTPRKNVK